jgi:L-ascorbate metabolism protein UlaG (beta-lactamase superfamily)
VTLAQGRRSSLVALLALGLSALAGAGTASAHSAAGASGGARVVERVSAREMVQTRQRYFGAANVDPSTGAVRRDRVILSWVGVSGFAAAIRGHVLLLDAWVPRGAHSGYVPSSPVELARLRPELIFVGHAHFDHAADATPLAAATGATLIGSAEQCAELQSRAAAVPPRCSAVIAGGAEPGTAARVGAIRGVDVRAVKHLHSAVTRPGGDPTGFHVPVTPLPSTTSLEHPPTPEDLLHIVGHLPDSEAGSVLYRFAFGDFSLVWHDTSGPLVDRSPRTFDALRALRPVDVQVGAIQGFNQVTNGMRDPRMYVEALAPGLLVPQHHDDWAFGITTKGEAYRAPLAAELARIPAARRPPVRFIADPRDYVRPELLTFPVRIDLPRIARRCTRGGRLRVRLGGDLADVRGATVRLGRERARRLGRGVATFRRSAVRRQRGRQIRIRIADFDGSARTLRGRVPRCR